MFCKSKRIKNLRLVSTYTNRSLPARSAAGCVRESVAKPSATAADRTAPKKGHLISPAWRLTSSQNLAHHVPLDVRQPVVAPVVAEGEALVIQAQEVKDGRVEVVDVNAVLAD